MTSEEYVELKAEIKELREALVQIIGFVEALMHAKKEGEGS